MDKNCPDEWSLYSEDVYGLTQKLKKNIVLFNCYEGLNREWKERFQDYCTGKKTLPVTYDPFFKRIFNPDIHPERLSHLISSLLEVPVRVVKILPSEESMLDGGVLLIMDILVELADGALANVEVQKVPYLFAGERISCYSADLVLRQYSRVKGARGNFFKYGDLKKVYTIVIFEKSTEIFHEKGMSYLHRGRTVFDTGLRMELLQEYCLVALDVFREKPYPKDRSEQTAWIAFLATDSLRQAEELSVEYPWLEEIYAEMAEYLHKPEEVLNMYSEALKIMDQNTVQYMIELQQQKLDEARAQTMKLETQVAEAEAQVAEAEAQMAEAEARAAEAEAQVAETEARAAEAEEKFGHAIDVTIKLCHEMGVPRETVAIKLQESYCIGADEAENILTRYWQ